MIKLHQKYLKKNKAQWMKIFLQDNKFKSAFIFFNSKRKSIKIGQI